LFATACSRQPKDEDIQGKITKQLQENADYKNINDSEKDGVVTLSGKCQGQGCDSLIENQVKGIAGVKSIINNMQKTMSQI
jgi:osmotically-inducible protein OsmY